MNVPEIDKAFYEALENEDDLGVVIRAHIHVESTIIKFINERLTDLKSLSKLRYSQRVELACDLGLNVEMKKPLEILGEIRNSFAHKINAELNHQNIDKFFKSFDSKSRSFFQSAYEATGSSMLESNPKFSNINFKDKFVIMVVVLKARAEFELYRLKVNL